MESFGERRSVDTLIHAISAGEYVEDHFPLSSSPFRPAVWHKRLVFRVKQGLLRLSERVIGTKLYCENSLKELRELDPITRATLATLVDRGLVENWMFNVAYAEGVPVTHLRMKLHPVQLPKGKVLHMHGSNGAGVGLNLKEAATRAFGELLERFSLSQWKEENLLNASYNKMVGLGKTPADVADWTSIKQKNAYFRKQFLSAEQARSTDLHWIKATHFVNGNQVFVPADTIYMGFSVVHNDEPFFWEVSTNGAAAHTDLETAIYKAARELIERDTFLGYWCNKIVPRKLSKESIVRTFPNLAEILKLSEQHGYTLHLLSLKNDFQLPVVLGILVDEDFGRGVVVTTEAGHDWQQMIQKVILESYKFSNYLTDGPTGKDHFFDDHLKKWNVKTISDRLDMWSHANMIEYIDWMWSAKEEDIEVVMSEFPSNMDTSAAMNHLRERFRESGYRVYWADTTAPLAKELGLSVARVVSPDMLNIYFEEDHLPYNVPRLYEFPVRIGVREKPSTVDDINKIPHPFG